MKMSDKQIAMYKIAEAAKIVEKIDRSFANLKPAINSMIDSADESNCEQVWEAIGGFLWGTMNIQVRKEVERTVDFDDLTGLEILKRVSFRSCSDAMCLKNHCQDCGECGRRRHDNHQCKCQACGEEFISSADGELHNLHSGCEPGDEV